jgi:hypothetical protein
VSAKPAQTKLFSNCNDIPKWYNEDTKYPSKEFFGSTFFAKKVEKKTKKVEKEKEY